MQFASLMQLELCRTVALGIEVRPALLADPMAEPVISADAEAQITIDSEEFARKDAARYWVNYVLQVQWPEAGESRFRQIRIHLHGIFSFPEGTEQTVIDKYVPLLCLTSLTGVARGVLAQATALCPGGQYLLPLLNMNEVLKSRMQKKNLQQSDEAEQETKPIATRTRPRARAKQSRKD